MPQTLLALAAIVAFSVYALNRHQGDAALGRKAVTSEVEAAVADVARAQMVAVEQLAFDQETVGRTGVLLRAPESGIGFEEGETVPNDIDDLHGFAEERVVTTADGVLTFAVSVSVRYVNPADPRVATGPSLAKEVVVTASEVVAGPTGRPPVAVTLRKVFTPAGMAATR